MEQKQRISDSIDASVLLNTDARTKKESSEIEQDEINHKNLEGNIAQEEGIDYEGSIKKDKDRGGFEGDIKKDLEREYKGRFSEQFEERKKKHDRNYENSALKLGLIAKNGLPIKDRIEIDLVELREKYVVLDVPAGMLKIDDQIELEAFLSQGGVERKVSISAATQIVETEDEDEAQASKDQHAPRSVAICELNEKIAPQFIDLVQSFKTRREEMTSFFAKAKGAAA